MERIIFHDSASNFRKNLKRYNFLTINDIKMTFWSQVDINDMSLWTKSQHLKISVGD